MSTSVQSLLVGSLLAGDAPQAHALDAAFDEVLDAKAGEVAIAAFLTALAMRPLSVDAIVAGARAMRARMLRVDLGPDCIDVCGTGGDGARTLNVSTAVAFVLAGAGIRVAKHGNRAMSSATGAADVLEALGVKHANSPDQHRARLAAAGTSFLFAQNHHPALGPLAPIRRALGFRTVFNLLGPLCNPAGVEAQAVGVAHPALVEPMAQALARLGSRRGLVYASADPCDELTVSAPSTIATVRDGAVALAPHAFDPTRHGWSHAPLTEISGADAAFNARALSAMLDGMGGPYRDTVELNAAMTLLHVCEVAPDLASGRRIAAEAIDSGRARAALDRLVAASEAV